MIQKMNDFISSYKYDVLNELPNNKLKRYYFSDNENGNGKDGVILSFNSPDHNEWVGIFGFGNMSNKSVTGVYSCPNKDYICVVSRGNGYIVNVNQPESWEIIKLMPIIDVRIHKEKNLIFFANLTEISAYNENGLMWTTNRISWDDLRIIAINEKKIIGKYFDIRMEDNVEFEVDIDTGKVNNGIGMT
jgi:hypothetical protein